MLKFASKTVSVRVWWLLCQGAGQEVGSSETRRALSAVVVLVLVYTQVRIMLWYNHAQANSVSYFGEHWYSSVLPPVLYFALCNLSGAIFLPVSACLNAFEKHPTKVPTHLYAVYTTPLYDDVILQRTSFYTL